MGEDCLLWQYDMGLYFNIIIISYLSSWYFIITNYNLFSINNYIIHIYILSFWYLIMTWLDSCYMDGLKDTIGGYVINWFHHLIILIRLHLFYRLAGLFHHDMAWQYYYRLISHLTLSQHSIAFTFTIRWSGFIYLLFGQPYNMFINSSHPQSSAWAATCIYWISRHVIFGKRCKYSYRWGLSTKEWVIFYNWPIAWWDGGSWFRVNLKQLIS